MKSSVLLLALSTLAATGQSTIAPGQPFVHATNFGWINFRPSAADGLVVHEATLSGRAWSANFGWIHFGDGQPQTHHYANTTAANYGVNLAPNGNLTGYAWCPNAGWLTFEQTHGKPGIDLLTGQFHGSVWSANAGWILMDTVQEALRTTSITIADTDQDGMGDAWEIQQFGNLTAASASSNTDGDPVSDLEEYRAGTLPKSPNDWLQVVSQSLAPSGASVTIRFTSSPNRLYRFEFCSDIPTDDWSVAGPNQFPPDAGLVTERTFTVPPGQRRFFKVTAIKPL